MKLEGREVPVTAGLQAKNCVSSPHGPPKTPEGLALRQLPSGKHAPGSAVASLFVLTAVPQECSSVVLGEGICQHMIEVTWNSSASIYPFPIWSVSLGTIGGVIRGTYIVLPKLLG